MNSERAASDAYYSFLDADPGEDVFPDVFLGRLPVDYDAQYWELSNVVTKIREYEPLPVSEGWVDSVLLVSGRDDGGFTFAGEGLSGFQNYFDSVTVHAIPSSRITTQLHRLKYPPLNQSKTILFGDEVAASIEAGKWITGLFDHGQFYYLVGAFYPRHYEYLLNLNEPTVMFSIASNTGWFDIRHSDLSGACCAQHVYPAENLPCYSPGVALDSCDVMAERLIVQPSGAVAVFAYSRSQAAIDAQKDFMNLFESLSEQNSSTLGEVLVGARMFRIHNAVTARNLMLFGDPALNIIWRDGDEQAEVDLAIGTHDIQIIDLEKYYRTGESIDIDLDVTVRNIWRNDAIDVLVEIWRGTPHESGSVRVDSVVVDTVHAYGDTTLSYSLTGLTVEEEFVVTIDPNDAIEEASEDNNQATRAYSVSALPYDIGFPVKLKEGGMHSLTVADVHPSPGKEVLYAGTSGRLYCYSTTNPTELWSMSRQHSDSLDTKRNIRTTPLVAYFYKDDTAGILIEAGDPSHTYILDGASGSILDSVMINEHSLRLFVSNDQKYAISDLETNDSCLAFVTTVYRPEAYLDTLFLVGYSATGTRLFYEPIFISAGSAPSHPALGVADIDRDGAREIVVLGCDYDPGLLATSNNLVAFSYSDGELKFKFEKVVRSIKSARNTLALIDRDNDGSMEILCNGIQDGQHSLRLISSDSSAVDLWAQIVPVSPDHLMSVGDVDGDGSIDIVVAESDTIRILSSVDGHEMSSTALAGSQSSAPLLVDTDNDGTLELVAVCWHREGTNPYIPIYDYYTDLYVLDYQLNVLEHHSFVGRDAGGYVSGLPAISDFDGDGSYEVVFVTADAYLHAFEIGSAAGAAPWPQRFSNTMHTNAPVQPIVGTYTQDLSLYQNTVMLGDVVLDSIIAPTLYIWPGTSIRVEVGGDGDGYVLKAFGNTTILGTAADPVEFFSSPAAADTATWRGLYIDNWGFQGGAADSIRHTTIRDAWIGIEHHSPLDVEDVSITNTYNFGIYSADQLDLHNSAISVSPGGGVFLGTGVTGNITGSSIDYHANTGVTCDDCLLAVADNTSMNYNGLHGLRMINTGGGETIQASSFLHNEWSGIRCDGSHPLITACTINNNAAGVGCFGRSNPTIRYSSIKENDVGVAGAENSFPLLGDAVNQGHNCFDANTAHHVSNLSSTTVPIIAEYNYWGSRCCPTRKFYGYVVCNWCDASSACTGPSSVAPGGGGERDDTGPDLPDVFDLGHGFPNPFNPEVVVPYEVPPPGAHVRITVFNVAGQRVIELVNDIKAPGYHKVRWSGYDLRGNPVASGVYFVRMKTPGFQKSAKLIMLK